MKAPLHTIYDKDIGMERGSLYFCSLKSNQCGYGSKQDLEECTSAYKDIEQVLEDERDLMEPIVKVQPIAVLKG